MTKRTRLELTWIGKENRPKLEPRVLIEDPEKSYHATHRFSEDDLFDNRLIFGDNLLALKSLEQEFTGKVKCIYIDPPYNTGSAFAEYEDGLEHSLWLSMMHSRLLHLQGLLADTGSIWVHLDDNEVHYCKVLMDEVFGRDQFVTNMIWQKSYAVRSNAEFVSASHEHILVYAKRRECLEFGKFPRSEEQTNRFKNPDDDPRGPWQSVTMTISLIGGARGRQYAKTGHSDNIYEVTSPSGQKFLPPENRCWSRARPAFEELDRDGRLWWGPDGDRVPRLKMFLAETKDAVMPTSLWADGQTFGYNQDGIREIRALDLGATFPTPKPERLLEKVIHLATNPGDLVLDSFAGSGTTGAVAHKMRRRWVMVELGDHCDTLIAPRLRKVVDGEQGGITEAVEWKGGGGFRYYKLGPTLIVEDEWGNPVINPDFNAGMLAEAMCKLEGFTFDPNAEVYWQQGRSSETDFIYVTTQFMSKDMLTKLSDEVGPNRSLLICCSAFRCDVSQFENLTVKKIPKAVLKKCEWGHDDYSLEIENLPDPPPEVQERQEAESTGRRKPVRKFGKDKGQMLFDLKEADAKGGK